MATRSLIPFGHGDGGGGPTREMLARAARAQDQEGLPTVRVEAPEAFFDAARAELRRPAPVVRRALPGAAPRHADLAGGDETRQPAQRAPAPGGRAVGGDRGGARAGRVPLRASCGRRGARCCCTSSTTSCPGSSIGWVHREARATYAALATELDALIASAQQALAGPGTTTLAFNAGPLPVDGVPAGGAGGRTRGSARSRRPRTDQHAAVRPHGGHPGRRRHHHVDRGRRHRHRGGGARRPGGGAATAPGLPGALGRLGHRPALPRHRGRRDRGPVRRDRRRRHPGVRGDRARLRQIHRAPDDRGAPGPPRRGDRPGHRLARAAAAAQARLRPGRARRPGPVRDPVRARHPVDPREHVLGRRPLRGRRAPLGARRRTGRGGGGQRRDVRPRGPAGVPAGWRHGRRRAGHPAARPAVPGPGGRPGPARVPLPPGPGGHRGGRGRGRLRAEPAAGRAVRRPRGDAAGDPGRRRDDRVGETRRRPVRRRDRAYLRAARRAGHGGAANLFPGRGDGGDGPARAHDRRNRTAELRLRPFQIVTVRIVPE